MCGSGVPACRLCRKRTLPSAELQPKRYRLCRFGTARPFGLRRIDPQQYLDEVLRVLPYWPKERHLELAPKHWAATRSNLNPVELDAWLCPFTVPPLALNFAC
jgi:hypothetical protein